MLSYESTIVHRSILHNYSHVPNTSNDLDDREEKFSFTIAFNTKQVDADNRAEEDGNKYCMVIFALLIPKVDGDRCCNNF